MAAPDDTQDFLIERPFNWGIVVLSDAESTEPLPELAVGRPFAASSRALVIAVRHAQDVDFEAMELGPDDVVPLAMVSVQVGPGDRKTADFSCVLDLPSGKLKVGDAEHEDVVALPPGEYTLTVALDDIDHAEAVNVRWTPGR